MDRKLFVFFIVSCIMSIAAHGQVFRQKTEDGVRMTFKVIDAVGKKVQVGIGDSYSPAIDTNTEGRVWIPAKVVNFGQEYTVTSIADYAFYHCEELNSVEIPNTVISIGDRSFLGCKGLFAIDIPNNVSHIGRYAFRDCSCALSVAIPNSVVSIGSYAFSNCEDLQMVVIESDSVSIGSHAFANCKHLTDFICFSTSVPDTHDGVFDNTKIGASTLHVLEKAAVGYKTMPPWKYFSSIETVSEDMNRKGEDDTYLIVDKKPEFPRGEKGLAKYIKENLKYPLKAQKDNVMGKVIVEFVVGKNGAISDAKVIRSVSPECDAEALRIIESMPKWKPGELRGRPVRVKQKLLIEFWLKVYSN